MDKFAQVNRFKERERKENPLNKVKQKLLDVPIPFINPKLNPRLQALLDALRVVDKDIREKAKELNPLLKAAKTSLNRREYMTCIAYLDRFHDIMESIDEELVKLNLGVDEEHYKFLLEDLDKEHLDQLLKIDPKIEKYLNKNKTRKAASIDVRSTLEKEAGIGDWWHNVSTDRGKTLSTWEKSYPKYTKDLKKATADMLSKATSYFSFFLSSLKKMDGLRTSSKLEEYLKETEKLKTKYESFNHSYIDFYKKYAKKYIDFKRKLDDEQKQKEQQELEEFKAQMPGTAVNDNIPAQPLQNPRLPFPNQPRQVTQINIPDEGPPAPKVNESKEVENEGPPSSPHHARTLTPEKSKPLTTNEKAVSDLENAIKKINKAKPKEKKSSYEESLANEFLIKLSSMEDMHPLMIAKEIILYAQECDDEDIRKKLVAIAKKMVK